jgi:hypothetical protein
MSQILPMAASPPNHQSIFDNALESYKKRTGKDITSDPLLRRLETCHSPDDVLVILQGLIFGSENSRNYNNRLENWLISTVNVLCSLSVTVGGGVGQVSSVNVRFAL